MNLEDKARLEEALGKVFQWQQRQLARDAKLRLFQQLHQDDEPEWYRAAGACRCSFCGLEYREHLDSVDGFDKRLCNAEVVHL